MSEPQTEAIQTEAPVEAPQTPDVAAQLSSRFDELSDQMRTLVEAQQQPQEPDPYAQGPQFDPYTGQPIGQEYGPDLTDPAQLQEHINSLVQQGIQQGVDPIRQDLYARDVQGVLQGFPEMGSDPKVQESVLNNLREMGHDPAAMPPVAALKVAIELHKAREFAAQQQPLSQPGQGEVTLEAGAAQTPQPQEDMAAMIKAAAAGGGGITFGGR